VENEDYKAKKADYKCTNDTDADARNCSLVGRLGLSVFDIIL
jgi:hypothetical protein